MIENKFQKKPFLMVRAGLLAIQDDSKITESLLEGINSNKDKLRTNKYNILVWRELKKILREEVPSKGIDFLRRVGLLKIILPELDSCFGVEQNNKYHKYTVYEHCLLACDRCIRGDIRIRFAALIHDVGKPKTKGINRTGITFHKHEVVGAQLTRNILNRFRVNQRDFDFIYNLVSNHMYQYDRVWKDSTILRFIKKVGLTKEYVGKLETFPLFQLRHADRLGRGLEPITRKQLDFEARLNKTLLK